MPYAKKEDRLRANRESHARNLHIRKSWEKRNPEKRKAHNALNNAVRDGRVLRQPCEVCGVKAQAHHNDYSKPLEVRWLCPKHHAEVRSAPRTV